MIVAMWNIRGLNKLGRLDYVKDLISNNNLDFVGLQETKKANFHCSVLSYIGSNFSWNYLPATGTAGGILLGFKTSKFEVIFWDIRQFSISAIVKNTVDKKTWKCSAVYGSAYDQGKQEFIAKLHAISSNWEGPLLIGGDFNLTRSISDKNNENINFHCSNLFNN